MIYKISMQAHNNEWLKTRETIKPLTIKSLEFSMIFIYIYKCINMR